MARDQDLLAVGSGPDRPGAARRDFIIIVFLAVCFFVLIANGSSFLQDTLRGRAPNFSADVKAEAAALVLNVALLLFGWRRYVDLQHEAETIAEERKRAERLAATDAITGLNNRKGFADAVSTALTGLAPGNTLAIVSIQMQRFKSVNDRHGYDLGDQLLRLIADSMRSDVPNGAVLARLSGDEFAAAVTLRKDEPQRIELIADALLRSVSRTYDIDGTFIQVGAFAGIAGAPVGAITRAADILRRADIALDHARSARSARPVWFDDGMERALLVRSELEQAIRVGLEDGQFIPAFEPQVDLRTGAISGFEVLASWQHPNRGMIGPDIFIPIAEEIGVIGRLSETIIAAALEQAREWDPSISLSVNISPAQLNDPWMAQRVLRLLTEKNFPPERLIVEVTESSLFADIDLARNIVLSLKNQGVRVALDDFGTGFSSLSHLRMLPLDAIKIDRSFVATLHSDRESAAIVKAVTTLASAIGVPVTVEGLEDAATYAAALALGACTGQGWYIGKPMSGEQASELLRLSGATHAPAKRRVG